MTKNRRPTEAPEDGVDNMSATIIMVEPLKPTNPFKVWTTRDPEMFTYTMVEILEVQADILTSVTFRILDGFDAGQHATVLSPYFLEHHTQDLSTNPHLLNKIIERMRETLFEIAEPTSLSTETRAHRFVNMMRTFANYVPVK